jgi:beta-lactamase regulating signal transducer with metallopeptidase domain
MNADSLLHWLLRTSLEASLLILAVLGLRLMLGTRLSPAWRIGLWMLVGAKLMLPAFVPAGFGLGGWMQHETTPAITQTAGARTVHQQVVSTPLSSAPAPRVIQNSPFDLRHSLLALWLTGSVIVLAAALYRQRRFNLSLRQRPLATAPLLRALIASLSQKAGIHPSTRILLMPAGTTPAVVGIVQPCILLPEDWESRFNERSLRHVLLHELLHVKQHDLIWNWVAIAVQALHWFNPLVWFVVSRFQADRELRCDAGALALLSPTERLDYGHTLLRIQETFFAPPAMAGLAPCVRNHPTLRQRIHMIAHPTARQPMLQLLLVLTLSALVCYSFTTARAAEKEVPAKERTREGARTAPAEQPKTTPSEAGTPARTNEGDGGTKKTGMREGDGEGSRKTGARDGEQPRTGGERDGEASRKTGMRDGEKPRAGREGEKPRTGAERDGEASRKTGMRDGEKPRTGSERDGEGGKKSSARDGDKTTSSGETITLKVIKNGEAVMVGDEEVSMNRLRGHLSTFLPDHPGAKVIVTSDANVPYGSLHNALDAVRDNGNKNVGIKSE